MTFRLLEKGKFIFSSPFPNALEARTSTLLEQGRFEQGRFA